jgi:hypothetical protein
VESSGVVACPTPDPDDAKAAIPVDGLSPCAKFAKIVLDFPQNLYDVASFEFNPSGNGFGDCLKAWFCDPSSELIEDVDNGLLDDLIAYWPHEEASGDVLDAHTDNHDLTELGGTLASGSGIITGARVYGTGEIANAADASWHDLTGMSFTWAGWVNMATLGTEGQDFYLFSKGNTSDGWSYYAKLTHYLTDGDFRLTAGNTTTWFVSQLFDAPTTGEWIFCVFRYDLSTESLRLSVGANGVLTHHDGGAGNGTTTNEALPFVLGGWLTPPSTVAGSMEGGMLDEVGLWGRYLSDDEIATLYNSGDGVTYSSFT